MNEPPSKDFFSCRLSTPELQKRKQTLIANLKALMIRHRELENGMEYAFDTSDMTIDILADFIKTERRCCDFFCFCVRVESTNATLSITGPLGSKEFLRDLFS